MWLSLPADDLVQGWQVNPPSPKDGHLWTPRANSPRLPASYNSTVVGPLGAAFVVTATNFQWLRVTPDIVVTAKLFAVDTSATPAVAAAGSVVMLALAVQSTASSRGWEAVSLPLLALDPTSSVYWGTPSLWVATVPGRPLCTANFSMDFFPLEQCQLCFLVP